MVCLFRLERTVVWGSSKNVAEPGFLGSTFCENTGMPTAEATKAVSTMGGHTMICAPDSLAISSQAAARSAALGPSTSAYALKLTITTLEPRSLDIGLVLLGAAALAVVILGGHEPLLEVLEDCGPGGVLHLLCSQDGRHEGSLAPHHDGCLDGVLACEVPGVASEDVDGLVVSALDSGCFESLKVAVAELESETADSRGSVVVDGVGVLGAAGVHGSDVASPHPSGCEEDVLEDLGVLSDGGESGLAPADADGIVLSDVGTGGHVELVGGYDSGGAEAGAAVDPLDGVPVGVAEEGQDAVGIFNCRSINMCISK